MMAMALGAGWNVCRDKSMQPIASDPVETAAAHGGSTALASGGKGISGRAPLRAAHRRPALGPPQPAHWTGGFNADRKGPACIQCTAHDINHYFGEEATGETA
jgi:para-nitrobenzyl esterase